MGQVPPLAFQGYDSLLQHPSPLSQQSFTHSGGISYLMAALSATLAGTGAMGDGPSSLPRPRSPGWGLHKGQFPVYRVKCTAQLVGTEGRAQCPPAGSKHSRAAGQSTPRNGLWVGEDTPFSILKFDFNGRRGGGEIYFLTFCLFLNPNQSLYQIFHDLVWSFSAQSSNRSTN